MRKTLALAAMWLCSAVFAQPDTLVTDDQRRHAAMVILVLVLVGVLLTFGLLWFLRKRGVLPEEKPDEKLKAMEDEIARRADEIKE
ncbi:MAG: hypothetical protein KKI08_03580 [Armatimonadetes bacterium]|nr:hypothetical protein [Armatimonadota bacterium]